MVQEPETGILLPNLSLDGYGRIVFRFIFVFVVFANTK